ncbi:MAG: hypothetical protein NC121_02730 [Blautia sp.]|nr:hypothetical protein [Blautia sp.]
MRRLTIHREKAIAACLMTVKIYITSSAVFDMENKKEVMIYGEKYRKLGKLKNGEEKTFLIGEGSAKVFGLYDLPSKSMGDCVSIPEGTEEIRISGRSVFAPSLGNPFQFNEQILPEV